MRTSRYVVAMLLSFAVPVAAQEPVAQAPALEDQVKALQAKNAEQDSQLKNALAQLTNLTLAQQKQAQASRDPEETAKAVRKELSDRCTAAGAKRVATSTYDRDGKLVTFTCAY